jgi:hypothetical protein
MFMTVPQYVPQYSLSEWSNVTKVPTDYPGLQGLMARAGQGTGRLGYPVRRARFYQPAHFGDRLRQRCLV